MSEAAVLSANISVYALHIYFVFFFEGKLPTNKLDRLIPSLQHL